MVDFPVDGNSFFTEKDYIVLQDAYGYRKRIKHIQKAKGQLVLVDSLTSNSQNVLSSEYKPFIRVIGSTLYCIYLFLAGSANKIMIKDNQSLADMQIINHISLSTKIEKVGGYLILSAN